MSRLLGLGLGIWLCCSLSIGAQDYSSPAASNAGGNLYILPGDDEPVRPNGGRNSAYIVPEDEARSALPPPPAAPANEEPATTTPAVTSHPIANGTAESRNIQPANYSAPTAGGIEVTPQPSMLSPNSMLPPTAASALPLAPKSETNKGTERPATGGNTNTLTGVAVSLALVLGLFFAFAWFARSSLPQGMSRLPTEVIEPLGRMPILGRQELHLLRLGNKLVLMAISPTGMEPISEVTDPAEVDRLLGLCRRTATGSSTAAFRDVVAQVSAEPTRGGFAGQFARAVPGTTRRS